MDLFIAALCAIIILFAAVLGYFLAKRYIAWMQVQKKKHPNLIYPIARLGEAVYFPSGGLLRDPGYREYLNSFESRHPNISKTILVLGLVSLAIGLVSGNLIVWVFVLLIVGFFLSIIFMLMKEQPRERRPKST